ncbi:hypothetical protein T492DRAFT_847213 [Pavlovales sp. CCMP2436]|nr:hypothetical protein T492DRAFT_847213 [Pavlovales sp. CCMP2436]
MAPSISAAWTRSPIERAWSTAIKNVHAHCEVHTFDPTLGLLPGDGGSTFLGAAFSAFHDIGLGELSGSGEPWQRKLRPLKAAPSTCLRSTARAASGTRLSTSLPILPIRDSKVGQLQIELHLKRTTSQHDINDFMAGADKAGPHAFHKEPDVLHGDGFTAIEYAFVHRTFACTEFVQGHCPNIQPARVCGAQ